MIEQTLEVPRVAMQPSRGFLVVTIQVDLTNAVIALFQRDLLERIRCENAQGIVIDLSHVDILDTEDFARLCRSIQMARPMGVETVLAGIRPGVASALVELGADTDDLVTVLNVEDGIEWHASRREKGADPFIAFDTGSDDATDFLYEALNAGEDPIVDLGRS